MTYNDIVRRLKQNLKLNNEKLLELFASGGLSLPATRLDTLLRKEEEPQFIECSSDELNAFLDGIIILMRGPSDKPAPKTKLNNNVILRKLKIAFEFKDVDLLDILNRAEFKISKSELSALFRKPSHRNYMQCQDQLLRRFMAGLEKRLNDKSLKASPESD